ncbi:hypothetical protein OFY17_04465 [Marinomonas sp. C2222]|uniref:DUF3570 domain-containing protein n=1 Tax=Marinomonas sargassi TaxID=2984494 RepID=A0ABT2YQH7_9GAMM|nr:hypothetical protein [Marinomonas sargassi]MCV2402137.1 hypothetical protein [Marinomonas sargassi]
MRYQKSHLALVLLFAFMWPFSVYGEELSPDEGDAEALDRAWWQVAHQRASSAIGGWSNGMDAFFSGQPSQIASKSHVEIRLGSVFENNDTSGLFDLHAKWELPNTKKRLRLVLDSGADTLSPENVTGEVSQQDNVLESALQSSVSAAVRFAKDDLGMDLDVGILVDFPLDPFVRLRFKQGHIKEDWYWYQKQEAFAYYSEGVGARYALGGGYQLASNLSYGLDFSVVWLDKEDSFYAREELFFQHVINERNQLRYELGFLQSGESQLQSDTFYYNFEYNRFLYKNWLSAQIKPQMTHEAEDDYTGDWSLTLSLVVLMGPEYLY